jgi:CubicO group peptidase (beta-lactamase class C family)
VELHGHCDPAFQAVREEFERNFTERGDVGASACVIVDGEAVVDLWGGYADPETEQPWQADTLTVVMSSTKGATALCAHMLADRGLLDFDTPVAEYWPVFAANGKDAVTVGMLLNHQAGLPALRRPLLEGAFCDWDYMVNALADEALFWEPGTRFGYHASTFGWLVGEVVRRVSGKMPGKFFRDEIAEPLSVDLWLGVPDSELRRVTPLRPDPADPISLALAGDIDPDSLFSLAFGNTGGYCDPNGWNNAAAYGAEICAGGGITNGRGLARMYAPLSLGGELNGVRLVGPETIQRMSRVQSAVNADATVGMPMRMTFGFQKVGSIAGFPDSAFGHGGWGGSVGFCDPDARLAFGYVMNQMHTSAQPRQSVNYESLATAAYRSLGYRAGQYGLYMR